MVCVAYGNRAYDDALLELQDLAEKSGFVVIGSGAFVARHSLIPDVARGSPDAEDMERIAGFAEACKKKLEANGDVDPARPATKGNRPYIAPKSLPMSPTADSRRTRCGVCVAVCSVKAIGANHPEWTDKKKCIACVACVSACPNQARRFSGLLYWLAGKVLTRMWARRREPETFI